MKFDEMEKVNFVTSFKLTTSSINTMRTRSINYNGEVMNFVVVVYLWVTSNWVRDTWNIWKSQRYDVDRPESEEAVGRGNHKRITWFSSFDFDWPLGYERAIRKRVPHLHSVDQKLTCMTTSKGWLALFKCNMKEFLRRLITVEQAPQR